MESEGGGMSENERERLNTDQMIGISRESSLEMAKAWERVCKKHELSWRNSWCILASSLKGMQLLLDQMTQEAQDERARQN